ncbi:MAG: flagellar biosynthesis protein FlhA, partial [Spirochaetaceae bacterium]|nr:flagellar biosynthesis protein FlhA [Spirochaetaceae bacterium]
HESLGSAAITYTSLTIGDGLVSQLPALIISMATGMVVTRSVAEDSFGSDVKKQFTRDGRVYWIAAAFLFIMGVLPGFPLYLLWPLGGLLAILAWRSGRAKDSEAQRANEKAAKEEHQQKPAELGPIQPLDSLSLELGYGLIPLVNEDQGAELLERVRKIRKEAAIDLGLMVPPIRIVDNMRLEHSDYSFKIKGVESGHGTLRLGSYLAINPGGVDQEIKGEQTADPTYGLPAIWISEDQRNQAERLGYTIVDPPSIIATHLTEIIKRNSQEIIGRQEIKTMLDALAENYPAVVEEVNKLFSHGEVQKILQNLLKEQVSVRNLVTILETICDWGGHTKDPGWLTEKVRQALGRQICQSYIDSRGKLPAITLDPSVEKTFIDSRMETTEGYVSGLEPGYIRLFINQLANSIKEQQDLGFYPIILTSEMARPLVRSAIKKDFPSIPVISVLEVREEIDLEVLGSLSLERGEP